jgi:hypothetical protein
MYVATVPNRSSPPAVLLRESYRQGTKVKTRTLGNLSHWPREKVEALRRALRGDALVAPDDAFEILRSRPHGHVAAVLGQLRRLGLDTLLGAKPSRPRQLCVAMLVERILDPRSKLATARGLDPETLSHSLGEVLGVERGDEDELYAALDWLLARQARIETALAKRHLPQGGSALYDLTGAYFHGRHCPLARRGYSPDAPRGAVQIRFGLLTNAAGCPVGVEVFPGNREDSTTLDAQIAKLRDRFGLREVVVIGDRGTIRAARIDKLRTLPGVKWITALRAPDLRGLVASGALDRSLFDETDLGEIASPDYPGERLVVCRNPFLAEERTRKRQELLEATERELAKIVRATTRTRKPLRGKEAIALRVGKGLGRYKVGKHFRLTISDTEFRSERDEVEIAREAALDGIYAIRTNVPKEAMSAEETVRAYKGLARVEQAFRALKTVDLKVRPIFHRLEDRVRAHVFLCMLAYYVEWHLRQALAPMLFDDPDPAAAEARRESIVAPAKRSEAAARKARTKRTQDGTPVHSFRTLLKDLATVVKNRCRLRSVPDQTFELLTTPTPLQQRAFDLLQVSPRL